MANWLGDGTLDPQLNPRPLPSYNSAASLSSPSTSSHRLDDLKHAALDHQRRMDKTQYLLNKTLGPGHVANRAGGGGAKLSYLEGWRAINIANEVFGYNGWYTEIKFLEIDFCDYHAESGRFNMGVTAVVKVRLQDGASHEDVGYGKVENVKSKGDGLDKCKKEAVTDALKRALRHFGKLLGNCLYDKAYLQGLSNMKAPKPKFDFASIYKPEQDNVPHDSPNAPWASTSASAVASTSSSTMPPPAVPKPAPAAPAHKPVLPRAAALNRAKTAGGVSESKPPLAARPPGPGAPPPHRSATVGGTGAPPHPHSRPAASNPLDRSGTVSVVDSIGPEEEGFLAKMDLDVQPTGGGAGVGETSFSSDGDLSTMTSGAGRVYFEGDSGFAESEDLSAIKDSPARPLLPPRHPQQPPHQPQQQPQRAPHPLPQRPSPEEAKAQAKARLAESQRKKEQQQQHLARSASLDTGAPQPPPAPVGSTSAAQLLRASTTGSAAAPPPPALGSARPPGLRPAQPPSRTSSLNNHQQLQPKHAPVPASAAPVKAGGHLPTLNVGSTIQRAAAASSVHPAAVAVGGGAGGGGGGGRVAGGERESREATVVPAAGGAPGVSMSPQGTLSGGGREGEGFVSARGVKRGVGDG
ncbi:hypothetical protein JCM8547_008378, partial [Rhodosporidiobolus lusitaniae]